MEEAMMKRTLCSKPKIMACYSHLSSFTKFPILTPKLKISLTVQFAKNRLRTIRGCEQKPATKKKKKKKKKKKHSAWIKPIHRLTRRITSMIYNSFGLKKSSAHRDSVGDGDDDDDDDSDEGVGERDVDESLEYLMYKLSLALDGTTLSRYIPLMELLNQMQDGGDSDGGGRVGRERKVGKRSFHVFWRRRRRRNLAKSFGRRKKMMEKEKGNGSEEDDEDDDEEEEEEWEDGEQLCNRRILMGWRCRPIKDDDDYSDGGGGIFLPDY